MQTEQYKGTIRNRTLSKILGDKDTIKISFEGGERIRYNTTKSEFIVQRRDARYWNVFQVLGMVEIAG